MDICFSSLVIGGYHSKIREETGTSTVVLKENLLNRLGSVCTNLANASLVTDCRHLISQIPQVKLNHCYCEANFCADALAKMGTRLSSVFMFFSSPLLNLFNVYISDLYGLYYLRLCSDRLFLLFFSF